MQIQQEKREEAKKQTKREPRYALLGVQFKTKILWETKEPINITSQLGIPTIEHVRTVDMPMGGGHLNAIEN
jgi:hypothetical protein